jgi:adenine-specific DNA methylase
VSEDRRLIEDYLPIQAISAEASREKSVRKGHISTLHLWWARRPLVACRAAVYGALVLAARWVVHVPITNVKSLCPEPLRIQNPAKHLDYAKREVVAARYFDIPPDAIERAALGQGRAV